MPSRPYSRLPPHLSTQQRNSTLNALPVLAYQDPFAPSTPNTANGWQDSRYDEDNTDAQPLLHPGAQVVRYPAPTSADPRTAPPEYKSPMSWQMATNPDYGYSQYHGGGGFESKPPGAGPSTPSYARPYSLNTSYQSRDSKYINSPESLSPPTPRKGAAPLGPGRRKPQRRKRGLFGYAWEPPQWRLLAAHFTICALTYPVLMLFIMASNGKSLFWVRVFVGAGCGVMGFALGISLMGLAKGIIEACTWATVIHQSHLPESHGQGIRLKDLAAQTEDPASAWSALRLLWDRHAYRGADIEHRKHYDQRKWNFWILVFIANVCVAGGLGFILGRIVNIDVQVKSQHDEYKEIPVQAALSADDIRRAKDVTPAFEVYDFTWTLSPFASQGILPSPIRLKFNNSDVYLAEVLPEQLSGGSGPGTFEEAPSTSKTLLETEDRDANPSPTAPPAAPLPSQTATPASLLRFPRWGIQIKCAKLSDPKSNIYLAPEKGNAYVFTPRSTLKTLFDDFNLPLPDKFANPVNLTRVLIANDTAPAGLNIADTAMGAGFYNNGVAHSLFSSPISMGDGGNGFQTIEIMLVRLNTKYAANGTFGTLGDSIVSNDGQSNPVGYDAVVCLELYEQYVVEVYNSTVGPPTSLQIIDKAASVGSTLAERRLGPLLENPQVARSLNSTDMQPAYLVAHQNSVNQMLKDNGRDADYVPSPTLVSFTDGVGPYGYTVLTAENYATARGLADAGNVLPYFVGSGQLVARQYVDRVISTASIAYIELAIALGVVFLMGLFSALFLPRLPLDAPHRGFDLYSWLSAFYADELQPTADSHVSLEKRMELDDIMKHTGDLRFRYIVPEK